jgi:hypothetical protein
MTALCLVALPVAVAAAVRSTWSPCGLSMLSTITPVSERGRGHRFGATCAWFVGGALLGGLALGAVSAGLAAAVGTASPSTGTVAVLALVAALVAVVSDTGLAGVRLPVHHRQVNERWLDAYRPWVYGAGFGFQIGTGVATYITTSTVYLLVVLGALTCRPAVALALCGLFGLVRGLAVTLTRRVATPTDLLEFHRRFTGLRPWSDRVVVATAALTAVVMGAVAGAAPALVAVGTVLVLATVGRVAVRHRPGRVDPAGPAARDASVAVG